MSEQSESINELATALALAQGKITGALKDSANPFFKSKYADLASVWDACRGPLSDNGLAVIQTTDIDGEGVTVVTTLAHKSGQWVRGKLRLMPKEATPQGIGSAITYGRRYALAAVVGVAQVDDDGNAASGKSTPEQREDPPEGYAKWKTDMSSVTDEGTHRLQETWKGSSAAMRNYAVKHDLQWWNGCKERAAKVKDAA